MFKLIELNWIKNLSPFEGIFFVLYCFSLSSTIFCVFIREGGRNEPFHLSDVIRMYQGFFQNTGHFYTDMFQIQRRLQKENYTFWSGK